MKLFLKSKFYASKYFFYLLSVKSTEIHNVRAGSFSDGVE